MEIWKILQPVKIQVASQVKIFNDQSFKNAFMGDKKHIDSKFRLILSSNSELKIKEIERNSENLEKALIAIQSVMEDLSKNEK